MTEPAIASICADDVGDVARIHAACFDEQWSARMLQRILAMPGSFGLGIRNGGVGGSLTAFALNRVAADECELLSLGVAPEHRRRGYGALLLDASMTRAAAVNARKFFLEVAEDNEPALKLYRIRGLVAIGRRPDYYELKEGGYAAALTMRCDLSLSSCE